MQLQKKLNIMNLAIISPAQNAYSETFIQAHKNIPDTNVKFYFGGGIPKELEGKGPLESNKLNDKASFALKNKLFPSGFTYSEKVFLKSLIKENIQCVLAEYGPVGVAVLPVCKKLNIPLIVHFHGYDASMHEIIKQYAEDYIEMFGYASAVIAVSRVMEQKILNIGCPREKLIYNTYGPNNLFFELNPNYSKKLFVGIGRFVDKKAPYYTLLAFQKTLKRHPDARLIIGGNGPLLNTCNNLVKYLKIENNVSFPGIITPEQYRAYLKESIAFVQHSITAESGDMEGTPVGILEASAAGLPVISTFHAGIPDVILHNETGLLVNEHDVDRMSEHMLWVLDNPKKAQEIGMKGRQRMKENFTMQRHLKVLSDIIISVAKQPS